MSAAQLPTQITPTPITNIHEAPDNPRIIPARAVDIVASSIDRFGWQQPIVTTADGEIIAGHTRYRAAQKLGQTTVPVIIADKLTEDEVKAYRIADNRSGDFASWDIPRLVDELDQLDGSFNDELALEDWDQIMADYEDALDEYNNPDRGTETGQETGPSAPETDKPAPGGYSDGEPSTDLADEAMPYVGQSGHSLTVIFDSDESLMAGRRALLDMPGVIDVKDKRAY